MLRIFTDTAANVPPHLLEQYHITAMPLTYLLDGQPTELVGHDYYEAMRKGAEVKTSLVSPALIPWRVRSRMGMTYCTSPSPAASAAPAGALSLWRRSCGANTPTA